MGSADTLVKELRSILLSVQGGLTFSELKRDYREINGSAVGMVCSAVGFKSLEAFVDANPNDLRVINGKVYATPNESSAHVRKLVEEQRSKKPKRRGNSRQNYYKPSPPLFTQPRKANPAPRLMPQPLMNSYVDFSRDNYVSRPLQQQNIDPFPAPKKAVWPEELFVSRSRSTTRWEAPERRVTLQSKETHGEIQVPFSKLKAKDPPVRDRYRHSSPPNNSDIFDSYMALEEHDLPELNLTLNDKDNGVRKNKLDAMPLRTIVNNMPPQAQPNKPPPKHTDMGNNKDVFVRLTELCVQVGLGLPEKKVTTILQQGITKFTCLLKVDEKVFRGGPVESENDAQNIAASAAFIDLNARHNVPAKPNATSGEIELFEKNLLALMSKRTGGVWLDHVPILYKDECQVDVPKNWQMIVRESPLFAECSVLNKQVLKVVSCPKNEVAISSTPRVNKNHADVEKNLSPDHNLEISPVKSKNMLPYLTVEVDEKIDVHVLSFPTKDTVIVRLIKDEYVQRLNDITTEMELQLLDKKLKPVSQPKVGEYYAAHLLELLQRVILESIEPNGSVTVYGVDSGDRGSVPISSIYELEKKYCDLAPQALCFQLEGLIHFPDLKELVCLMQQRVYESFVGVVFQVFNFQDVDEPRGSLELYDTSANPNVNLNRSWMEKVVADLPPVSFTVRNSFYDVIVIHAEGNFLYVSNLDKGIESIESLIEYAMEECDISQFRVKKIVVDRIYVGMHSGTKKYQRIQIKAFTEKVEVYYLDVGETSEIDRFDIYDLPECILQTAPPRVAKVSLINCPVLTEPMRRYLTSTIIGSPVIMKVKEMHEQAQIELYWRNPATATLQCVNKALGALNDVPIVALPDQKIPNENSLLYVTVALTINPSSFKVRLKGDKPVYSQLMKQMLEFRFEKQPAPESKSMKVGEYYAAKNHGAWYRGKLEVALDEEKFSVQLVDVGTIILLTRDEIRELPVQFRKYPVLLYQAALHGVKASLGDWSPADCVFFQNTVANKELAATLKKVDFLEDGKHVLGLILIDTTDPVVDVYVHKLLIEQGMACPVN